jgi:hypothetical protein
MLLEDIILEMKSNLDDKNQKIKLSEDLRLKIKTSIATLNSSIFDLNYEMLDKLHSRK